MHTREINHVGEEVASGASSKGGQAIPRQREHKKITWEQQKNQHWLRLCDGARSLVHSRYERNVRRGKEPGAFKIWKKRRVTRARERGEHGE